MPKKEQPANINNNVNNNNNIVNVRVSSPKTGRARKAKPNWLIKAIVIGAIGLITSIIIIFVKHSTVANGKPAYIQSDSDNTKEEK